MTIARRILLAFALTALTVEACSTTGKPLPRKDLLTFITDGRTSRAEVIANLGAPSAQYEDGRLLTYRIAGDSTSRYSVALSAGWEQANYSLVVQCTAEGIVVAHKLVAVKGH